MREATCSYFKSLISLTAGTVAVLLSSTLLCSNSFQIMEVIRFKVENLVVITMVDLTNSNVTSSDTFKMRYEYDILCFNTINGKYVSILQILPPWPLVDKRIIPTERPPLFGEVSANFYG
jgi:hypothetical protein